MKLSQVAKLAQKWPGPLIVAGDLNTSNWSYSYKLFEQESGLINSKLGFGIASTWPSSLAGLGIGIDHILTSDDFMTESLKVGPTVGSDHRPIIATLYLKKNQ